MELAYAHAHAFLTSTSRDYSLYPAPLTNSTRNNACFGLKFKGSPLPLNTIRFQRSYIAAAVVGDRTAVPNDSVKESMPVTEQSDTAAKHEAPIKDSEEKDGHKMVRVTDKLIDLLMVDKPTPTDWRRLLVFSKNWSDIRPHFYKRCQDRADNEDDPGMKHKLLRLGNKLKEAKDILYHLYKTARGNLQRLVLKEIKIVNYLLTIKDPKEQFCALKDVLTPGEELEGQDVDCLYTTPEKLHTWIKAVVDAYHFNREGTLIREPMFHSPVLASCLQTCSTVKEARKVHAVVIKHLRNSETFVDNNLISAYLRFGSLADARKVFDTMSGKNVVSWTAILSGYLKFGLDDEALRLYIGFMDLGLRANSKTFVCLLNLCCRRFDFELGKQIHACLIKGNCSNLIVDSAVVHFYALCGDLQGAFRIFDRMRERDVVSWTTMISACSQNGWGKEAFTIFIKMLSDGFAPNEFTLCSVLKSCGEENRLQIGRQLHAAIVKKICRNDVFVGTSLVDMYAKCGEIEKSRMVFDGMRTRNMVTWTSIISGYARNGHGEEAINLFRVMKRRNISANKLTMVSLLRACGLIRALSAGKELHAQIVRNITQSNIHIGSTLVWLYCKCGEYSTASKVLQEMPLRDVVSWTAMISGCARLGHEFEALEFLKEMLREGVEPNPFTYSSALKACAKQENIWQGKSIHSSIQKTPALSNVFVGSTLINMYAKCGHVSDAFQVFDSMPERNLVSWKAMIVGYARSGHCREALRLMYRMQAEGIEVDNYVLATVLTACGDSEWSMEPSFEQCLQSS